MRKQLNELDVLIYQNGLPSVRCRLIEFRPDEVLADTMAILPNNSLIELEVLVEQQDCTKRFRVPVIITGSSDKGLHMKVVKSDIWIMQSYFGSSYFDTFPRGDRQETAWQSV